MNLGKTSQVNAITPAKECCDPKEYYPTLYLSNVPGLEDLPDGVFSFAGTAKVVSHTETSRDGKESCSCELEVRSIEPVSGKKSDLKSTLDKMEMAKMDNMDDMDD